MKIQRVRIDGFKNLSDVDISFDRLTSIVSVNNLGKSNFLIGIKYGISFIKANNSSKALMLSSKSSMPFNKSNFGKNFCFEIETKTNIGNQMYIVLYSYETKWAYKQDEEPLILKESLKIKRDEAHQKYTTIIDRNTNECFYKASPQSRCVTKLKLDGMELAINKLKYFDDLFCVDIIKKLNSISLYMEDTLDPRLMYNSEPVLVKDVGNVMFMISNLPKVLYKLKENNKDKYDLIESTFISLFPNIEELNVAEVKINTSNVKLPDESQLSISDSIYLLSVKDKNLVASLSFEEMSDGAKKILVLLTRIILAEMSNVSLIAVEEPENSIHPSLLNSYIQVIASLLDDSKLIFTSHSPYIISYLSNESIYAGLSDNEGGVIFKRVNMKPLIRDAKEVDMLTGDYLFSLIADESELINDYLED